MDAIINMGETAIWYDMPGNTTLNAKGEKSVLLQTSGHEKSRFTVTLAARADGTKLPVQVIFKGQRVPPSLQPSKLPCGVVAYITESGWQTSASAQVWLSKCF